MRLETPQNGSIFDPDQLPRFRPQPVATAEIQMQRYEFRILGADNRAKSVLRAIHINDFAAIRRAQSLPDPARVWKSGAA
jgi:hypothetical protein